MAAFSDVDVGGARQSGATNYLNITVSDPVKQNEGINAYITYKVNTHTDRSEFQFGSFSVVRRYSDFVWLATKLGQAFPGAIVPPLPEKSLVGRFENGFVEVRRRALEKFLTRVAHHPDLVTSKHLGIFLQADDAQLSQAKEQRKQAPQPKKMMDFFSNAVNQVQHSFQQGSMMEMPKSPDDALFEEVGAYVATLDSEFNRVQRETSVLIKREKEQSDAMFQFGLALTLLAQSEVGGLGDALRDLGHTADQLSVASATEAEREALQLEEPITEYCRLVASVKSALGQRHQAKVAYHNALLELDNKTVTHNRLRTQPGKEEKAHAAEMSAQKAQAHADQAKQDFEAVSTRFLTEFDRFKAEKGVDLKRIMLDYVKLQAAYHSHVAKSWADLLPKLEAADIQDGNSSAATQQESKNAGPLSERIGAGANGAKFQGDNGEQMGDSTLIGV